MMGSTKAAVWGATSLLLAAVCSQAHGQWLPDRNYTEGPGIRVGNLELHPGLALRGGYDTNVFRVADEPPEFEPTGSAILAATPHLHLSTLTRQRMQQGETAAGASAASARLPPPVAFDLGVSGTLFYYVEDDAPTNVEFDAGGALSVLPERVFGFDLGAEYTRSIRPFTDAGGDNNQLYAFNRVQPKLLLRSQSRAGVLKGSVGFTPSFTIFEADVFDYLNVQQYEVPALVAWRFLPFTALVFDGSVSFQNYGDQPYGSSLGALVLRSDGKRFQGRLGVNGALTRRISLRALIGYAAVVLDDSGPTGDMDDREDVVGELALTYAWSQTGSIEAGYQRSLIFSHLGGWMQQDRGYVRSAMLFGGVFAINLEAGAAHVNYGTLLAVPGSADDDPQGLGVGDDTTRDDVRVDGRIGLEYRATNWFALMADFSTLVNLTDFEYDRGAEFVPFPAEFQTYQIFGGVRAHY